MENEASRSNGSGDSYIGSLISLTSKSDIRYEGVLININTHDSTIGLRNVRSFGTEGRKQNGPQVPPSDKVYEYILFRGSDIKDLQVKSSPPVQTTTPIHDDPAIIQSSHYPQPGHTATSLPPAASVPVPDLNSHTSQPGVHKPTFQASLGTRDLPNPPPPTNVTELATQMYWQGVYGPPGGLQAQQPLFLQPLQSPLMPPSMPPMNVLPQKFQPPPMISNFVIPTGSSLKDGLTPPLVTPGQFLQPGPTTVSSYQSSQTTQKNVEVAQISSSEPPVPTSTEAHAPILPLPLPQEHKLRADASQSRQIYRGEGERGRGNGISRSETNFTEEFDFTAMNEKFNKDEVWGDLGKSNKPQDDKYGSSQYENNAGSSNTESKHVYVKDDFFDSISCNAFGRGSSHYGRTKFSEQMKLDTETFGDFPRFHGGRGSHSRGRGGGYYGRGYGYGGRGRGYNYY